MDSSVLTVRLASALSERLDALAESTSRSKSFLAAEAIAAYLESQEWQVAQIESGIAELDAGKTVPAEQVDNWLRSWGRPDETKPPRCE